MLWNMMLHVAAGIFGSNIFKWTGKGIVICLIVTAVVQGIDMFRVYHVTVRRIQLQPQHIKEQQMATFKHRLPITFPQIYIAKVIGYSLVILIVASIMRAIMH